ncbi:hypothetical protein [Denitromonas sp.]
MTAAERLEVIAAAMWHAIQIWTPLILVAVIGAAVVLACTWWGGRA